MFGARQYLLCGCIEFFGDNGDTPTVLRHPAHGVLHRQDALEVARHAEAMRCVPRMVRKKILHSIRIEIPGILGDLIVGRAAISEKLDLLTNNNYPVRPRKSRWLPLRRSRRQGLFTQSPNGPGRHQCQRCQDCQHAPDVPKNPRFHAITLQPPGLPHVLADFESLESASCHIFSVEII